MLFNDNFDSCYEKMFQNTMSSYRDFIYLVCPNSFIFIQILDKVKLTYRIYEIQNELNNEFFDEKSSRNVISFSKLDENTYQFYKVADNTPGELKKYFVFQLSLKKFTLLKNRLSEEEQKKIKHQVESLEVKYGNKRCPQVMMIPIQYIDDEF